MKHIHLLFISFLMILSLQLAACAPQEETQEEVKPVSLEPIEGTDLNRLTLTEKAAERLGLETAEVSSENVNGVDRIVIPYAALLYDPSGQAWAYVAIGPLQYQRQAITVDSIEGGQVILSGGLDAGATVVTLGATELFGSESEFEEE